MENEKEILQLLNKALDDREKQQKQAQQESEFKKLQEDFKKLQEENQKLKENNKPKIDSANPEPRADDTDEKQAQKQKEKNKNQNVVDYEKINEFLVKKTNISSDEAWTEFFKNKSK